SCSRDSVTNMLKGFSKDDRLQMIEDGVISVTCEFCSTKYVFAPAEGEVVEEGGLHRAGSRPPNSVRSAPGRRDRGHYADFGRCLANLINCAPCVRAVERKRRDLDLKELAVKGDHPVSAGHDTRRGRQRNAARIFERSSGFEHWFLANNAGAAYFLRLADGVSDDPVAGLELDRLISAVSNFDRIGPEVAALFA